MIHITSERWEKYKHDIVEDDYYASKEFETTTLYFMAPAGIADGCTNEDVSVEISMEFPTLDDAYFEAAYAGVSISPTKEVDGTMLDYDWSDWDAPYEYINFLLELYYRNERMNNAG